MLVCKITLTLKYIYVRSLYFIFLNTVSEMALRPLQRTLRMYSSACSTKRQFTGMRAEFAAIRCGVYTCQTRTMFSEWMYSRKNVDIVAPVYLKAYNYPESVAIVDHQGEHTYGNILYKSHLLSTKLLEVIQFTVRSHGTTATATTFLSRDKTMHGVG